MMISLLKFWKPLIRSLFTLVFVLIATLATDQTVVYADTPIVTIANWDWDNACVDYVYGEWDIERVTRDTLPGEWVRSWPIESLRTGAVLIRATVHHFQLNPEYNDPAVPKCDSSVPFFHLRNSRIQGWYAGRGAVVGNDNNQTNDRVTDTGPEVALQEGAYNFLGWGTCEQYRSRDLANQGWLYTRIITDPDGIYNGSGTCHDYATNSTLSVDNATYSYVPSLTNHTDHVRSDNWGSQTDTVTSEYTFRQAENYWGTTHIDQIRDAPAYGYSEVFAKGWHEGDAAEYRMYIGGNVSHLWLKGIADRPGPVPVNIYIDGYYKGQMAWNGDNNLNEWIDSVLSNVSYGIHLVAVEFADDEYTGSGLDQDRNFFLDILYVGSN